MREKNFQEDISSEKDMVERSSKFISLSGISGVLAGIYAIIGAYITYTVIYTNYTLGYENEGQSQKTILIKVIILALSVFFLAIISIVFLTIRKCQNNNLTYWNPVSRHLLFSMLIPLILGAIVVLFLVLKSYFSLIAASCLIFYGLALVAGSKFTFKDVRWLGLTEIFLGFLALAFPDYGLGLWTVGFGFLHIGYGTIMHFRYER